MEDAGSKPEYLWLAGDSFSGMVDLGEIIPTVLEGSIFVTHSGREVPGYLDYVKSPALWDIGEPWYLEAWEDTFDCDMVENRGTAKNVCVFNSSLVDAICQFDSSWILNARIYDSIYVYANALHNLIASSCPLSFQNKSALTNCITGDLLQQYILETVIEGVIGWIEFTAQGELLETLVIRQFRDWFWMD